jgi:hypothetical protein
VAAEKIIAFCGIDCASCPAYIGTAGGDEELLKKTAEEWSTAEEQLTPEDVICHSCTQTEKRLFTWCKQCRVKDCCREKDLANCAYCDEYACDELKNLWDIVESQEPRRTLDDIRREIKRL